ncbi:MAG TPA: hypothetical protein VFI22_04025 [Thermomicrobiales bacterium]|nr:hypothetical protein [Thermomicrobiales bacterium]
MDPRMRRDDLDFLADAFDPDRVGALVAKHLAAPDGPSIAVAACKLTFARRGAARQLFQYQVRLRNRESGDEWTELVTALAYAVRDTEQLWAVLQSRVPATGRGEALAAAAYVPELDILFQTFPFDYRLPALAPLIAGRLPGLADALLGRFGPGEWRIDGWRAEPVRYRVDLRATVRVAVRARAATNGAVAERRFFAKVYASPELAATAWDAQRRLAAALAAAEPTLALAPIVAYLPDARVLAHDEVGGASLEELIADDGRAVEAVRATGRALATLHQLTIEAPERPQMDRVAPERLDVIVARLQAARPDLAAPAAAIVQAIGAGLSELEAPLPVPVHGDLKPAHVRFDRGRVVLLDLDKLSAGEPLRDVADLLIRFGRGLSGKRHARLARLRRPFVDAYLAAAPEPWARRLPAHYAAALLREAAAASESARAAEGERPGRRAKRADYPGRLLEAAQAVLTGDDSGWDE